VTRRQRRKIILIVLLVLVLLALAAWYAYFRATKRLDFDFIQEAGEALDAPVYLYSFAGPENDRMARPVGVFVDDALEEVYVTDSRKRAMGVYTLDGEQVRTVGTEQLVIPLYVAKNPTDGNIYVSDRRTRSVQIYKPEGGYVGVFDPKLPDEELPDFETGGVQWAPVALAFSDDGSLYVTEILKGHRMLIFDPDGTFVRSVGTVGLVNDAAQGGGAFQFPNSIKVQGEHVYVADSNNRRVQVFSLDGEFERIIVTGGLPRGIDFLARSGDESKTAKFVTVDTLSHDSTIWDIEGEKLLNFGEQGVLEGQFSYPNDVSVGPDDLIFVTDTVNARVQVWGWPEEASPIPVVEVPTWWRWCFSPLLLLPLLLLLRKKRFFATTDFIDTMIAIEAVDTMPHRRRRWLVTEADYPRFEGISADDVDLGELLHPTEYSESDVTALMERLDVDKDTAIVLVIAQRARVFCTQTPELRRLAKSLEIDVVDHEEFLERFGGSAGRGTGGAVGHEPEED
jgi:sugar lactone lactonase YvrE